MCCIEAPKSAISPCGGCPTTPAATTTSAPSSGSDTALSKTAEDYADEILGQPNPLDPMRRLPGRELRHHGLHAARGTAASARRDHDQESARRLRSHRWYGVDDLRRSGADRAWADGLDAGGLRRQAGHRHSKSASPTPHERHELWRVHSACGAGGFVGGPLAFVRTGDHIAIDVAARSIEIKISDAEMERRRSAWTQPEHAISAATVRCSPSISVKPTSGATSISFSGKARPRARDPLDECAANTLSDLLIRSSA